MPLKFFSQTETLRKRRELGLHPINEVSRSFIFVACYFCSVCVSLTYAFDLFSTQFRDQFDLSVGDLSTISTVGLVFCYLLIPYSAIYEKFGPFIPFLICGVTGLIGSVCLGLVFEGKIKGNVAIISVLYAFLNTASGLFDISYISTLFEIYPRNRGLYVCLGKVMTGLGSSIMACISATLFNGNVTGFIYFISALCPAVALFAAFTIVLPPYVSNYWRRRCQHTEEEQLELEMTRYYYERKHASTRRTIVGYVIAGLIIIFVTIEAPILAYTDVGRGGKVAIGVIIVVLTLSIFLMALPVSWLGGVNEPAPSEEELNMVRQYYRALKNTANLPSSSEGETEPAKPNSVGGVVMDDLQLENVSSDRALDEKLEEEGCAEPTIVLTESRQDPRYGGDNLVKDYFLNVDLWLLLLYFICVLPLAIVVSFNSSSISIAMTGKPRSQALSTLYTAFLGVGNACGRILFGLFESFVQHQSQDKKRRILITASLPFNALLLVLGGVLLLVLPGKIILFPFIIIYLQNGENQALNALMFTCLFEKFHNTLYGAGFVCTVIVVICFNRLLFGMYNDSQHKALNLTQEQECNQKRCVLMPLIVCTCLAVAAACIGVVIHIRYTRFVNRVKKSRKQNDNIPLKEEDMSVY